MEERVSVRAPHRVMRLVVRVVGLLLISLTIVAALEGVLRLIDFHPHVAESADPLLALPLFHPAAGADGEPVMRRQDVAVWFRRNKPPNGFRVFVVGESSAWGFPFGPEFAFSRFLQERLQTAMPTRAVEVVNAGLPGIGSWHARKVVDEIVNYDPDVILVYMGHNEFSRSASADPNWALRTLSQLRFYQLAGAAGDAWQRWRHGAIDAGRARDPADPFGAIRARARGTATLGGGERQRVTERYTENLRAIVAAGRAAGASVILAGLGQNLTGLPPAASRHRCGLSRDEQARWRALVESADRKMREHDYTGALEDLTAARYLDDQPAILHYLRGQCLEVLGQFESAGAAYLLASDLDAVPMGAPSSFNRIIEQVAKEGGAQFVDVQAGLMRSSPHGLIGGELFADHLHPSLTGHAAIARIVADAMGATVSDDGTDIAALAAAHPELQEKTYLGNIVMFMMLGWYDRALAELDRAVQQYPALSAFRSQIESLRQTDPEKDWDDFPDACD